ncbi:MAG: murein biosynthesis integral membrane protein MurJ [Anaerolineae bacterium]|nr:murein biosynthesis integral membrane protein MurJ [Anaerolineae bacterium]
MTNIQPAPAAANLEPAPPDNAVQSPAQAETNDRVARATGILALGNIASRGLGMAREVMITTLFGASSSVDAFYTATIVPKTIYDLLVAGHVNSAIVPVLSENEAKNGLKAFWQTVSVLVTLLTALLAALTLAIIALAPQIIGFVGSGYNAPTTNLAAALLQLTAPALIFLGLFSVISGALYALHQFTLPALAGVVFNGCIVLVTFLAVPSVQVLPVLLPTGVVAFTLGRPPNAIQAAALGWLIGSIAQFLLLLPGLRGAKLRPSFNWRHPAVRQISRLYAPVMFTLIIDTLVVRTFSYNLASNTIPGALGYMNWATTLIQFPQGLVATAISIAILPTLSRFAALIALDTPDLEADDAAAGLFAQVSENTQAFKATLGLGLRLAITLILPATIGLFVLAAPIVTLLFQHGQFTPEASAITAAALRLYLIGLPFAAVDLLLVYAFYARQDTLTPALIGLASFGVYMLVAVLLLPSIGLFSLMVADSLKHITHALISAVLLRRRIGGYGHQRILITLLKAGLAAAVMGLVAYLAEPLFEQLIGSSSFLRELLLVMVASMAGGAVYIGMAALLQLDELRWIVSMVRKRVGM